MSTDIIAKKITDRKRDIRSQFSNNFARIIDQQGLTQASVALAVSLHWTKEYVRANPGAKDATQARQLPAWQLSRWARGQFPPDPEAIEAIAHVLDVKPDELVAGVAATTNPNAVNFSVNELEDGRFYVEFSGAVGGPTKRELMAVLAKDE